MSEETKVEDEVFENENKRNVQCQFCNSLILRPRSATFVKEEFKLPLMHQKNSRDPNEIETETLSDFWSVGDTFTFENIGFSNTVQKTKFLVCADCEMGPVGYHDIDSKISYVALNRVKYAE